MAGFKNFMKNLLYESVEEEQEEERPAQPVQAAPVQAPAQPAASQAAPSPAPTKVFQRLDAEALRTGTQPKTARKANRAPVRKRVEVEEYQAVISPIFGNLDEEQKDMDMVHNAIDLPKPPENMDMVKVISPMYGAQPVHIEPKKMAAPAKNPEPEPETAQESVPAMDLKAFLTKPASES